MAKKKKHEEHENLERWLVSYADFMTLLFATFVVLYALAQTDVNEFTKLQDAIKSAFKSFSFLQGEKSILKDSGQNVINTSGANDALIDSLFMEYISPKYEEQSFEQIEEEIKKLKNDGLNDVTTKIDDRGLVITLNDSNIIFEPASATLSKESIKKLDYISALIGKKFMLHLIRVEGHTDNEALFNNPVYPSNWELSTARACTIVRYMIDKFKFVPDLFTAVGFADTRPVVKNNTPKNKALNRRIEIIVLKNKNKSEPNNANIQNSILKMSKKSQKTLRDEQLEAINKILNKKMILNSDIKFEKQKINDTNKSNINAVDPKLYEIEAIRLENKDKKEIFYNKTKKY